MTARSSGPRSGSTPTTTHSGARSTPGRGQTYRGVVPTLYGQLGSVTSMFTWNHRLYYTPDRPVGDVPRGFAPAPARWVTSRPRSPTDSTGRKWPVPSWPATRCTSRAEDRTPAQGRLGQRDGQRPGDHRRQHPELGGPIALRPGRPAERGTGGGAGIVLPPATLQCVFDASASRDPDGTVTRYDWDFGDGATAADAGATPSHTYAAAGTYSVTVTVTDAVGATATAVGTARPTATLPATIGFRAGAQTGTASTASVSVTVPAQVEAGDTMVLFETINNTTVVPTDPVGWTLVGTLKNQSASSVRALVRTATADDAGSSVTMTYSGAAKASAVLLAYSGVSTAAPLAELATAIDPPPWRT